MEKKGLSAETSELELTYFGLQAYWGITKHYGGLKATRELIELCRIGEGKRVLDAGCGVGATACYIAKKYGCRVIGVDISERMIDVSRKRARKEGVEDNVEFIVADVQSLPFKDTTFDAVISESVLVFVKDKRKALSEYVRVTKPRGYIGLNECTWIKIPPPKKLIEYLSQVFGSKILASYEWRELLKGSGLREVMVRTYKFSTLDQFINEIRLYSLEDILSGWYKFLSMFVTSPTFRELVREKYIRGFPAKAFFEYLGYGLYVGRK